MRELFINIKINRKIKNVKIQKISNQQSYKSKYISTINSKCKKSNSGFK